jgi:nascent polypeptide-associated complex subunit alpha
MKINQKQIQQAMRQMGVQQEDIAAKEVIIRLEDKELVIQNPSVAIVKMMGQESFQISGTVEVRPINATPELSEDDVNTVVSQTGASTEVAREALERHEGDIAKAILELQQQ